MKPKYICFCSYMAGMMLSDALSSLKQDYHGKDKYIELVQNNWLDASTTVPCAIVLLIISVVIFTKSVRALKKLLN